MQLHFNLRSLKHFSQLPSTCSFTAVHTHSANSFPRTVTPRRAHRMCLCSPSIIVSVSNRPYERIRGDVGKLSGVCVRVFSSERYVLWVLHIVCASRSLKGTAILNTSSTHTGSHTHAHNRNQRTTRLCICRSADDK